MGYSFDVIMFIVCGLFGSFMLYFLYFRRLKNKDEIECDGNEEKVKLDKEINRAILLSLVLIFLFYGSIAVLIFNPNNSLILLLLTFALTFLLPVHSEVAEKYKLYTGENIDNKAVVQHISSTKDETITEIKNIINSNKQSDSNDIEGKSTLKSSVVDDYLLKFNLSNYEIRIKRRR